MQFVKYCLDITKLRDRMRYKVNCAKSHPRIISEARKTNHI